MTLGPGGSARLRTKCAKDARTLNGTPGQHCPADINIAVTPTLGGPPSLSHQTATEPQSELLAVPFG